MNNKRYLKGMMLVVCMLVLTCLLPLSVYAEEDNDKVIVGWYYSKGFSEGMSDEEYKDGYAYEYLQHIANYAGWEYEYVYGTWMDLYDELLKGNINILCGISYTDERNEEVYLSENVMGYQSFYLYVSSSLYSEVGGDYTRLNHRTIGTVKDSYLEECLDEWLNKNDIECFIDYYDSYESLIEAFDNGEIDALTLVGNSPDDENLVALEKFGSSDYYVAVNRNRKDLYDELNNIMNVILNDYPYFNESLEFKYFENHIVNSALDDYEVTWLDEHQGIKVGFIEDYLPFSGYDENGEISGVIVDIFNEWKKHIRIDREINIEYIGYSSYPNMIEGLHNGEIDAAFPITDNIYMSENDGIIQTNDLLDSSMGIIYKGEYDEHTMDVIAISDHSAFQSQIVKLNYPESRVLMVSSAEECLEAVRDGRATATLFNSGRGERYLSKARYASLNMMMLGESISYCIGVEKGNVVVYSLLEKGLFMLDKSPFTNALYKYINIDVNYGMMDYIYENAEAFGIVCVLFIIFMVIGAIAYFRYSKREIEALNKERISLNIMNTLIRDYANVYLLYGNTSIARALKLEGYVTDELMHNDQYEFDYVDALNKYIEKRVYIEDAEMVREALTIDKILKAVMDGGEYVGTYRTLIDGNIVYFQYKFIYTGYEDQIIVGFQNIDSLVKEREENRTKLEEALKTAEEASEAKTNFLFSMSHDIRTPMNAIIGFTELLEKTDDEKKRYEYLSKIKLSSHYLLSLINNILEMSRIESGRMELKEELFDMNGIGRNIYQVMEQEIKRKELNFTRKVDIRNRYVYIDIVKLREILLNILSNAVKYTNNGGSIRMFVNELESERDGYATYQIEISDSGIGISEEFLPHIFDEFTREKTTTESRVEGTGLGLAITKRLVDLMDGRIDVISKPHEGTSFIITLTLKIADIDHLDTASEDGKDDIGINYCDIRILIAEDNEMNLEIAKAILGEYGFIIESAANGREALDMIENHSEDYYDIVLMDVQMPIMNGYEAAKAIRSLNNPVKANIPIIAMTANAFEEDKKNAADAGMDAHISKPFNVSVLLREMTKAIVSRDINHQA